MSATFEAYFAPISRTTTMCVPTSALETTAPMAAKPRERWTDASWRSQRSVAFTTDTAASPDRRSLLISGQQGRVDDSVVLTWGFERAFDSAARPSLFD